VHYLQGKAKLVTSAELLEFLATFYRDKLTIRNRHVAAARFIRDYNVNNTYQYLVARDDMHVRWLQDAITDLSGTPEEQPLPELKPEGKPDAIERSLITADRDAAKKFNERWTERVESLPNARHRSMLRVILGEMAEQVRFFEQALAGRDDLLGRRADGAGTPGSVLSTRWVGN
jgi:bacterioferritin (cytochrome b1)